MAATDFIARTSKPFSPESPGDVAATSAIGWNSWTQQDRSVLYAGADPGFGVRGGKIQVQGGTLVEGPGGEAPPPRKLLQLSIFRA